MVVLGERRLGRVAALEHPRGMGDARDDAHPVRGRVLDELDQRGFAKNTLVLFSSDNGTTHMTPSDSVFGVGGADANFFNSTGDLRAYKGSHDKVVDTAHDHAVLASARRGAADRVPEEVKAAGAPQPRALRSTPSGVSGNPSAACAAFAISVAGSLAALLLTLACRPSRG